MQENNSSVAAASEELRATIQADVNQRQRPFHCHIRNIGMNTGDDAINYDDGYETNITRKEKRPNLGKKDNRIHKKRSSLKKTSKRSKADIEKEEKRNKHQKEAVKRSKLKTTKKKNLMTMFYKNNKQRRKQTLKLMLTNVIYALSGLLKIKFTSNPVSITFIDAV